jgi:hypothetical protein
MFSLVRIEHEIIFLKLKKSENACDVFMNEMEIEDELL